MYAEDDPEEAARRRTSPVRPGVPPNSAEPKATTKRAREGHPVHRLRGLPEHLAPCLTRNTVQVQGSESPFGPLTVPTELQLDSGPPARPCARRGGRRLEDPSEASMIHEQEDRFDR